MLRQLMIAAGRLIASPGATSRVVVLCYHSVHPTDPTASVTPELFERHLRWLRECCELIPFRCVLDAAGDKPARRPAVAITFDDGYADNFERAFPLLQNYRFPATFFVTVGFVEGDPTVVTILRNSRQGHRADLRPLTWAQVREMRRGGMDIGAHSYSHRNLARLERNAAAFELSRSKEILEERLGERVRLLAYPFGKPGRHYTARTRALASATGYEHAAAAMFRAVRVADSPLAIPRFFVARDSVDVLREKVFGAWDLIGWCQETIMARGER